MSKRFKPNQAKAQRQFTAQASQTHKKNVAGNSLRGGIRL